MQFLKSSCFHFFKLKLLNSFSTSLIFSVRNINFFYHETSPHVCQKMNLIIHVKKNEKSWILKIVYVIHLLFFSDF